MLTPPPRPPDMLFLVVEKVLDVLSPSKRGPLMTIILLMLGAPWILENAPVKGGFHSDLMAINGGLIVTQWGLMVT